MCKITSINYIKENEFLSNIKKFNYVYLDYFTCKNFYITDFNHLLSKVNNPIQCKCFKETIKILYEKFYGYDENNIDIALLNTMKQNQERRISIFYSL